MVMKEIPREESAEEKPLLTMTSQVGGARGSAEAAGDVKAPGEWRHARPKGSLMCIGFPAAPVRLWPCCRRIARQRQHVSPLTRGR